MYPFTNDPHTVRQHRSRPSGRFTRSTKLVTALALLCLACAAVVLPVSVKAAESAADSIAESVAESAENSDAPPNIVFILVDDQDWRLGSTGYMANLQELLVDEGTTIDEFFVTQAVCCPSRASILRGQYTHNHEVFWLKPPTGGFKKFHDLGHEQSTVATWLQDAGYRTALFGKYLNYYPTADDLTHVPPGWNEWYGWLGNNGSYDYFDYSLNENGTIVDYGPGTDGYITDVLSDKTVDFIQRAASAETPFFVYLAPLAPHGPTTPAPRHQDAQLFRDIQVPRVPSLNEADISDKPSLIRQQPLLSEEYLNTLDSGYRQTILSLQAVDEMVARVVSTLEESGQLENTYIIYTSDNGFHRGHHRLTPGKASLYEEDVRVPFIVRGPGIPAGQTIEGYLAGNIDIAPTMAAIAGVTSPDFVDGRSLLPLLHDPELDPALWRQAFLLETTGQHELFNHTGVRTSAYKYVVWNWLDEYELYDLDADPYELENCAGNAVPETLTTLNEWLQALKTCEGERCRTLEEQEPEIHAESVSICSATFVHHLYLPLLQNRQSVVSGSE